MQHVKWAAPPSVLCIPPRVSPYSTSMYNKALPLYTQLETAQVCNTGTVHY